MTTNITGIILAGGESSRMGVNKPLVSFHGKSLIEYSITLMKRICKEVIISASHPHYETFGLPVIRDNYPSIGPLGGIEASLAYSATKHNLVISCDTPFVCLNVYFEILRNLNGELAVVPRIKGHKPEPLTAYYSKEILPIIQRQIKNEKYKIQDLLKEANVKFVEFTQSGSFGNLNTFEDMEKVSSALKQDFPNLILIAGDRRKVGKTLLACKIIKHLSAYCQVIGIKISPHFHVQQDERNIICKNDKYVVIDEQSETTKDSSLMLQAGAKRVFFIMAKTEHLTEAFSFRRDQLVNHAIVCESGGLHEVVQPGLFLFVKKRDEQMQKKGLLKYAPVLVTNHKNVLDFDEQCIGYNNNQITLNNFI